MRRWCRWPEASAEESRKDDLFVVTPSPYRDDPQLLKRKDLQPNTYLCKLSRGDFFTLAASTKKSPLERGADPQEAALASRKSLNLRKMLNTTLSCHSEPKAKNLSFIVTGSVHSLRRVLDRSLRQAQGRLFTAQRMTKKGIIAVKSPFLVSSTLM